MRTRESEEMYLETIFLLKKKKANVRSVDIVDTLNYAKSSVSKAVNLLVKKGYITLDRVSGDINFTDEGKERAEKIYERHMVLTKALEKIGANSALAEENACRIEHVVSDELFEIIKSFINVR